MSERNSGNWTIHLPTGLGPLDGFAPLRCGDLDSADDNMRLLPGSVYGRDIAVSGRREEIARVTDESQVGSLSLSCTEEAASGLDRLRLIGCPFPIQRRSCGSGGAGMSAARFAINGVVPLYYEHYSAVNLGKRSLSQPTATGIDKDDDTPTVTMPGVFGRRFPLTDKAPNSFDFEDYVVMGVVYCYNPLCGDCVTPCERIYVLLRIQDGPSYQLSLQRSDDGGNSWTAVPLPGMEGVFGFITCYQGQRLFVGDSDGIVYWSDNPEGDEWYEAVNLNELLDGDWVLKMVTDGYGIFAIYGNGSEFGSGSGGPHYTGIARSLDNGLTWHIILEPDTLVTGTIYDLAIGGKVVAIYGETTGVIPQVLYSYDYGDWQTWTSYTSASLPLYGAIGVDNPNPFDSKRAWFYVMGMDNNADMQVWKASDPEDWTLILTVPLSISWLFSQIFLDADGYIGWFHASATDGTSHTVRTSDGGNTFVDVTKEDTAVDEGEGRAVLAVCPHDPDEAFLGYNTEGTVEE